MSDTKMLQAILDGQNALKEELATRIQKLEGKTENGFQGVNKRIDLTNERLDKIGKSLAYLEDDAPTNEEFDKLGKRVTKLEKNFASE